jgi:hypothetical protein
MGGRFAEFLVEPLEAVGVTHEAAGLQVLEPARAVPWSLVVGVEHIASVIGAYAARGAHPGAGGNRAAVGRDLDAPAAVLVLAVKGTGQAKRDPDVAVPVELRAERVFVVVAVDLPAVAERFDDIGAAVVVRVA